MSYIGNTNTTQAFTPAVDFFSGNASTVAFTLSRPVASVAQVEVYVSNVPQTPGTAYTVSGNTITFTSAPPSGTNNIYVYYTSPITQVIAPSQGTVTTSSLASSTGSGAVVLNTSPTITTPIVTTTIGVGNATPSASGSGVSFPATQSASTDANTLDDYEEVSTYTPTWNGGGSISVTQSTVIKIGKLVTWTYDITFPTATGATLANIVLPYAMSVSWGNGCLNYTTSGILRYISVTSSGLNLRDTTFGVMTITALSGIRIIGNAIYEATS